MKVGDILYFVDISLGKVSKHKINTVKPNNSFPKGDYACIIVFTGIRAYTYRSDVFLNPTDKTYFNSHTKMRNSHKTYLVFTKVEEAYASLMNYVIPRLIEQEQKKADEMIKEYHKLIEKVEDLEDKYMKLTDKSDYFENTCNALEKKFV
jgi:hypothetical protein